MEKIERLKELVIKLHEESGVRIEPTYPRILVRQLPKEQKIGSIYLPDHEKHQQNKPAAEGIVLRTYKPLFVPVSKVGNMQQEEMGNMSAIKRQFVDDDGKLLGYWLCSTLTPGDHVLYPHIEFGIIPVWPLDDGKGHYKLVPEGIICSRLQYQEESKEDWLGKLLEEELEIDGLAAARVILKNADVIRKDQAPLTLSGA